MRWLMKCAQRWHAQQPSVRRRQLMNTQVGAIEVFNSVGFECVDFVAASERERFERAEHGRDGLSGRSGGAAAADGQVEPAQS